MRPINDFAREDEAANYDANFAPYLLWTMSGYNIKWLLRNLCLHNIHARLCTHIWFSLALDRLQYDVYSTYWGKRENITHSMIILVEITQRE